MNVYAPADDPVVVFVGTEERKTGLVDMLKRLVGATALLSLISAFLFVFQAFGQPGAAGGGPTILELLSFPGLEFLLGGCLSLDSFSSSGSEVDRRPVSELVKTHFEPSIVLSTLVVN